MLVTAQAMPLLVKAIRQTYTVFPLFQSFALAVATDDQRSEEIVAFANVLVPNGQNQRLFVQLVGSSFECVLFVEHWIQIPPFDAGFIFLISVGIGFDLSGRNAGWKVSNLLARTFVD